MADRPAHLVLPSGAVLVSPPQQCPGCNRMAALFVTTVHGNRCSACSDPKDTIGALDQISDLR